jgi:hypothetical protein
MYHCDHCEGDPRAKTKFHATGNMKGPHSCLDLPKITCLTVSTSTVRTRRYSTYCAVAFVGTGNWAVAFVKLNNICRVEYYCQGGNIGCA